MKKFCLNNLFTIVLFIILIPVFIYADDELLEDDLSYGDSIIETSTSYSDEPVINARHAIILDRNSKKTIYGKNENEKCKMASTTKIMTAIIVIENSELDKIVEVSSKAAGTGGSRLGLSKNDKISVEHLLYGLMLCSGNDAAVALAESTAGNIENFALMMNKKAKELNLTDTNFVTPHGLDNESHFTSACDLAHLADYALKNKIFSKIVKTQTYAIYINGKIKTLHNTNELLGNYEGIYGIKTGFTNGANRCLVTSCKRGDLDFICVVLGCDTKKDRTRDSVKLLNYAFNNFTLINTKDIVINKFNEWKLSHKNSIYINKGKFQNLNLYLDEKSFPFTNVAIKSSEKDNVCVDIVFSSYFEAPLHKNTCIGNIFLSINNTNIYSINILNKNDILKKKTLDYILLIFQNYFNYFAQS